jgi:hypothetical protein
MRKKVGISTYIQRINTLDNTERPHHSLNKKSPLQYFCDIMNSNKSELSQTGITYTNT